MNDSSNPPAKEQARRPFSGLRFLLFCVVVLITLLALAWAIENWRGARVWAAAKRDLIARGEPVSIAQLVSAMPPDNENFAATPLFRGVLDYSPAAAKTGQNFWLDPKKLTRLQAIALPPTREPPVDRKSETRHSRRERPLRDGRIDLASYALGIRMMPLTCPPNLDPALAERYGYLRPGAHWKKPTNELEIAASIQDPAQEVLKYLKRFEPELQEIAQAVRRPDSQFPLHYEEDYQCLLPHLAPLKQFSLIFSVRAAARLRERDMAGAFADTVTCLRLAQALKSEPLLISQLVHFAQHSIALKPVWEGLIGHQWNTEQLVAIQSELGQFDFQHGLTRALRGERVLQNQFLDRFGRLGAPAVETATPSGEVDATAIVTLCGWVPGWTRQNQVRLNRYDELQLSQALDLRWPANLVQAPEQSTILESVDLTRNGPYSVLARLLVPDFTKTQAKAARACTVNRMAIIACALERYRLEHSAYPKDLAGLSPGFLKEPLPDPMSGAPFHYEPEGKESGEQSVGFRLWSVGLNGQDDGGVMLEQQNDQHGDWVWPEPVPQRAPRLF